MSKPVLDRRVLTDVSWWHWTLTLPFVAAHLAGQRWALAVVAGLCASAGWHFWRRIGRLKPYPVQVRFAYFVWTAVGVVPGMHWMHWIQLFGTTAMVAVGYCPLIRLLSLLPSNRQEPFTISLLGRAFFKDPCSGGLLTWRAATPGPGADGCGLPSHGAASCSLQRC